MSGYTQSPCQIDAKEGGEFSLFNGSITGRITKLTADELCEDWRFKEWEEGAYSQVRIQLEAVDSSSTKLTLTQTNIPHADKYGNHGVVPKVEQGWQNFFWIRIQVRTRTQRTHTHTRTHTLTDPMTLIWPELPQCSWACRCAALAVGASGANRAAPRRAGRAMGRPGNSDTRHQRRRSALVRLTQPVLLRLDQSAAARGL